MLCLCGKQEEDVLGEWVQCCSCYKWQHCTCVGFSAEDNKDDSYRCPQCLYAGQLLTGISTDELTLALKLTNITGELQME